EAPTVPPRTPSTPTFSGPDRGVKKAAASRVRGSGFPWRARATRRGTLRSMPNTTRFLTALVLSLATLLTPTTASAHDRPLYAGFGGGPYFLFGCCQVHGRVQGEFGVHFSRDDTGFFLAFEAVSTFGDDHRDDFFMFFGGVRL